MQRPHRAFAAQRELLARRGVLLACHAQIRWSLAVPGQQAEGFKENGLDPSLIDATSLGDRFWTCKHTRWAMHIARFRLL